MNTNEPCVFANKTFLDFYKVLGCKRNASIDELKRTYQKLILSLHPDKVSSDLDGEELFLIVQKAWSILRDPQKRKEYDALLLCHEHSESLLHDIISLADMENISEGVYSYQCRCGGVYVLEINSILPAKVVISCDECSLSIQVNVDDSKFV